LSFSSTDIFVIDQNDYKVKGLLNFHGIEIEITVPVKVSIGSNLIEFNSSFKVNLNNYNIERPKLLLKPISELIEVELFIKGTI
jgi:polyisoprenoid-binding protein YceI